MILTDNVINPGSFTGDIQIVRSVSSASLDNWSAIKMVWANGSNKKFCLSCQSVEIFFGELGYFYV